MDGNHAELRRRSGLHDDGHNVRTPVAIEIAHKPRRPVPESFELLKRVIAHTIERRVEEAKLG